MRFGTVNCTCGTTFYFETESKEIRCIQCGERIDVSDRPAKAPEPVEEETEGD